MELNLASLQVRKTHYKSSGSSSLTFPFLANVDASSLQEQIKDLKDGVYYGYAKVVGGDGHAEPMVMSIGQNVTFDATHKTVVRANPWNTFLRSLEDRN